MKKHISILILVIFTGVALLSVGNGCSKSLTSSSILNTESGTADSPTEEAATTASTNEEDQIIPGAKTVSLVYSRQVVEQLSSCSGVTQVSDRTTAMYEQKKGAISTYGSANTVTSPMMMAVTSIAGEICNDLIEQELASSAGKRIFTGFDLNSTNLPSTGTISSAVSKLALSCWQRNESSTELDSILDLTSTITQGQAMANRKTALVVCTAMLSSLDALLN